MKNLITILTLVLCVASCKNKTSKPEEAPDYKIPVHAWDNLSKSDTDEGLLAYFTDLKNKGVDGLMYSAGHDPGTYRRVGKIAKQVGMEFHTWIPTMVQNTNPKLKPEWYAINRKGESAFDKPAYVSHYQFLCPSKPGTYNFLEDLYGSIADVEEVDGIHLDYIRFPDVILARGLWEKYGLTMDVEHPQFDYCYCDDCTSGFKAKSGIDIKSVEDPTQLEAWKQYRYDLITNIVNKLADMVHGKNKVINAAVFPGPNSEAKRLVRQEWNTWNLDAFYPMNYNDFYLKGTKWIGEVTHEAVTTINNRKPVFSGLFICPDPENKANEKDPEGHGLLPEELEPAVSASMANGAKGICLFNVKRMTDADWKILKDIIHTDYTK